MYISPEAADGQFVIPVIDAAKYPQHEAILEAMHKQGICAVRRGEEKSPSYAVLPENMADMFPNDDCPPVYGSWMLPNGDCSVDEIVGECYKEISRIHGFSPVHLGINCSCEADAAALANSFGDLFGFSSRKAKESYFTTAFIELMLKNGRGTMGHIGIGSHNVRRSMVFLSLRGVEFDWDTVKYGDKGINLIYFKDEMGGFAVHLVKY